VTAIIVTSIRNIELPHELRQIGLGRLDNQMKMIAHEHIGVHTDAENLKRAPESIQKARPVVIVAEDDAPVIASASHMIKSIGVRDPQWPRHNPLYHFAAKYESQDLTPAGHWYGRAQKKYREFVRDGIGKKSLWEDLQGQSLLGEKGFVEGLMPYVAEKREIVEIPKGQRYVGRPSLAALFNPGQNRKSARNKKIVEAVEKCGYSQVEVATYLKLHYSTVSRLVNERQ
jgi:hypothetical protein